MNFQYDETYQNKILEILARFAKHQIFIAIGWEIEFYCKAKAINKLDPQLLTNQIQAIFNQNNFNGDIITEKSKDQFEIRSQASLEFLLNYKNFIKAWQYITYTYKNQYQFYLQAKPFINQPGNGLHINLSLHKAHNLENLFISDHKYHKDLKNQYMGQIITQMLYDLPSQIKQFIPNKSIAQRIINCERNTPTHICWGKNNRTTIIRIPESLPENKRIEHRLASSENNILEIIFLILNSTQKAIFAFDEQNLKLPDCVFGNANDPQYNLMKILDLL